MGQWDSASARSRIAEEGKPRLKTEDIFQPNIEAIFAEPCKGDSVPLDPLPKGMIPFGILRLLRSIF